MQDSLTGPLLFAVSMDDPGAAARLVKDYSKDHEKLIAKLVAVGGELYDASQLERLSSLPTYDQAIAMLMGVMKAPIEKFVRTLAEPNAKLVRTFAAVRDAKEAA
jgi:large subunit ribosomal protein L10